MSESLRINFVNVRRNLPALFIGSCAVAVLAVVLASFGSQRLVTTRIAAKLLPLGSAERGAIASLAGIVLGVAAVSLGHWSEAEPQCSSVSEDSVSFSRGLGSSWMGDRRAYALDAACKIGGGAGAVGKTVTASHYCELVPPSTKGGRMQYYKAVHEWRRVKGQRDLTEWIARAGKSHLLKPIEVVAPEDREQYRIRYNGKFWADSRGRPVDSERLLFVVDSTGRIYAGEESKTFRHTSLTGGRPCRSVGELRIERGVLRAFTNSSGHYRPGDLELYDFLRQLRRLGVSLDDVRVPHYQEKDLVGGLRRSPTAAAELERLHVDVGGDWMIRRICAWLGGIRVQPVLEECSYVVHPRRQPNRYELIYRKGGRLHRRQIHRCVGRGFVDSWYLEGKRKELEPHPQILIDKVLEEAGSEFRAWNAVPLSLRQS